MPQAKTTIRLRHMLDHAREAVALSQGKSRADLDANRLLNLSLARLLEIIGEAASQIPREEQILYSAIPWPQIIGLRHRLTHGYDAVDFDILWQIVTTDLPLLIAKLEKVISSQ